MCGIISIFNPITKVNRGQLSRATTALAHRGPDGEGVWISKDNNIGLGHRRLSIIDPSGGAQPLVSPDSSITATVNGEFYDYKKIRSNLQAKGYVFKTQSDSEIVLHLYKEYGLDFVDHLRGEFALVLYDERKKRLIAVRDRFGVKPLQYHLDSHGTLYIASEAKAIFAAGVQPAWDHYALYHSLSLQYLPQDRTLFKDVYQLKPGHILIYNGKQLDITKYWDLDFPLKERVGHQDYSEEQLINELEALLEDAISVRLQTDGAKYCCQLSGGVDSATIAALAAKTSSDKLRCFTISFKNPTYDETNAAKRVASYIGAEFIPVKVETPEITRAISDAVYYSEGLAINNHLTAKYILNKEIRRQGYKIVLTGEGADENFAGYVHLRADLMGATPAKLTRSDEIVAGVQFPTGPSLNLDAIQNKLGYIPTFLQAKGAIGYTLHGLMSPAFKTKYSSDNIIDDLVNAVDVKNQLQSRHVVNQSSYLWIKFTLANYILKTLGDGTEMAHGIEGRVPFLDHNIFEFSRTIPLSLKIRGATQKYILRKIAQKYIPKDIAEQPKQTFMAPPSLLLNDPLGVEFIKDTISSKDFDAMGLFDSKKTLAFADKLSAEKPKQQVALEPALMLMLTTFLIHKRFALPDE